MGRFGGLIVIGSALLAAGAVHAQDRFPSRPMRILVGYGAGSATDVLARTVAQRMSDNWGQGVVVDNRPGAGAVIASELLVRSSPDGHTLVMVSLGHAFTATLNNHINSEVSNLPLRLNLIPSISQSL